MRAVASEDLVAARVPALAVSREPILTQVGTYLAVSESKVPDVYRLEAAGGIDNRSPAATAFVLDRLAAGAAEMRDLIVEAWQMSDDAKVGYPGHRRARRRVRRRRADAARTSAWATERQAIEPRVARPASERVLSWRPSEKPGGVVDRSSPVKQTNTARALAACRAPSPVSLLAASAAGAQTPPARARRRSERARASRVPGQRRRFRARARRRQHGRARDGEIRRQPHHRSGRASFAQRMIDDHSTAAVKLEAATRGTNLRPGAARDGRERDGQARGVARLASEDGIQRDNDYMRMQVPAHRRALALLQWESDNGPMPGSSARDEPSPRPSSSTCRSRQTYLSAHNLTPYEAPPPAVPCT